ncbi:MAG: aldo/keto reductase [Actinobacteria bacterium]|nr:aldo/keto reductase [Actinomycetota bacterium]
MPYNRMGHTGLKLSALSFGSWVTFGTQIDTGLAVDCLAAAKEGGVNFFDNAEAYGAGLSETIMGAAIAQLGWARHSYVISTKLFWGLHGDPNMRNTLNRKYLMQAIDGSLERLGLDFVDICYCHRPDPDTPIIETVWAFSDMIAAGKVHYWGTSEWSGAEIAEAIAVAERHHLHAPVVEQPQYNLFERRRVEHEYARLYSSANGLGLTTWSPLSSGLLSGKYVDGIPEGSRATLPGYEWLANLLTDEKRNAVVRDLAAIAERIEVTPAQLSIAWCLKNPAVTSVILGASRVEQVTENLGALDALGRITPEIHEEIELAFLK